MAVEQEDNGAAVQSLGVLLAVLKGLLMTAAFRLHTQLEQDSLLVGRLALCLVRLVNDRRFPWLILIPTRPEIYDVTDLTFEDRLRLWDEGIKAGDALRRVSGADKLNFGILGNLVPQLHFHVVARFSADPAWPGPVWGFGSSEPYAPLDRENLISRLHAALSQSKG